MSQFPVEQAELAEMAARPGRKLIIQIPCLNEAEQLPVTLADLPREMPGFDTVEWLIVDDGSTDDTVAVARAHGVDHVVSLAQNRGLAEAFMAGIEACLRNGADVIVTTDADNQYRASSIPALLGPINAGEAEMVVGARPIVAHAEFSALKKALQRLGSWSVRRASGTRVPDAPSGFRAITRRLALKLFVFNSYTYTLETIIQAGRMNEAVTSVPIEVNPETRPSRLFRSMTGYISRSAVTIVRIFMIYRAFHFFGLLTLILATPGMLLVCRFLIYYLAGDGDGKVQSLVIGAGLLVMATITAIGGLLADMMGANRRLLGEIRSRQLAQSIADAERDAAALKVTESRSKAPR